MDTQKIKEGLSIKEIENFAKKHRFDMFFFLALVLASFFSFIFFAGWSPVLAGIGGILGVLFSKQTESFLQKTSSFVHKQENITQIVLGIAGIVLSIFLPILTFLLLGICSGIYMKNIANLFPSATSPKEDILKEKE